MTFLCFVAVFVVKTHCVDTNSIVLIGPSSNFILNLFLSYEEV